MATRTVTNLPVTELPVAEGNWDSSRKPIDTIILHTMVGTVNGANARFNKPNEGASAHYGVDLMGHLYHWVDEDNNAYHCGNYAVNLRSIGIENEDGGNYDGPRTPQLYEASSQLVADICKFYNIPCDRDHIKGHNEVSIAPTACPDALDLNRIIEGAIAILSPAAPIYRVLDNNGMQVGAYKIYQNAVNKVMNGLDYKGSIQMPDGSLVTFTKPAPEPVTVPVSPQETPVTPVDPTPTPAPEVPATPPTEPSSDVTYRCAECGLSFPTQDDYVRHYFTTHALSQREVSFLQALWQFIISLFRGK